MANKIRVDLVRLHNRTHTSHIGSEFSSVDIMIELYFEIMNITPQSYSTRTRDYFILSKGHASPALYDILYRKGFISREVFESYGKDGSPLAEHPSREILGIDSATGSLGHGLSIAAGIAYSLKCSNVEGRVFCLLSDGECQEGSTIEAANFSGRMKLDNLVAIVDNNGLQGYERTSNIQNIASVKNKFASSHWFVEEMDGHNFKNMRTSLSSLPKEKDKPSLLVANTLKGKGVKSIEDKLEWHYKSPSDAEVENFINQILASGSN